MENKFIPYRFVIISLVFKLVNKYNVYSSSCLTRAEIRKKRNKKLRGMCTMWYHKKKHCCNLYSWFNVAAVYLIALIVQAVVFSITCCIKKCTRLCLLPLMVKTTSGL